MILDYLKALHIIFVITWFSSLFYLLKILIEHSLLNQKSDPEKTILMDTYKKLELNIWKKWANPSSYLAIFFGFGLIHPWIKTGFPIWLILKIIFVILLMGLHHFSKKIMKEMHDNKFRFSQKSLKLFLAITKLFLVLLVSLATLKSGFGVIAGFLLILFLLSVLYLALK